MMKLLLAVIATCALVVSPTCIKIKHQLRSNAPTIDVVISNGNTQMTSQVARDGSHRFTTDNLSNMTLAPAGTQTITLSYDQIFPLTDAAVCTEVHPLSAGGCADGVCCKISISMYTITDAIIMTARVNNRKADGNPQFWKCEQEIQVPGVTNTELSPEELVTDILGNEAPGIPCSTKGNQCGTTDVTHLACSTGQCVCVSGYVAHGTICRVACSLSSVGVCASNSVCDEFINNYGVTSYGCFCNDGYGTSDGGETCVDIDECEDDTHECHTHATCGNNEPGYTCDCDEGYYGDDGTGSELTCTECQTCETDQYYCYACDSASATCAADYFHDSDNTCCKVCAAKKGLGTNCDEDEQCLSNLCHAATCRQACTQNGDCDTGDTCNIDEGDDEGVCE